MKFIEQNVGKLLRKYKEKLQHNEDDKICDVAHLDQKIILEPFERPDIIFINESFPCQ